MKTKADIIDAVMASTKKRDIRSRAQAERIVNSVFDAITAFVLDDEMVVIHGFGTFNRVLRSARSYITPQGEKVSKPETEKLVFKASKINTKMLNS